ncbi:hypothetical protein CL658_00555 [bacterium]|nr:hypothetical protein [bacterium]|tara:strand:+ start:860 stop:1783 length:924 start_codon:yes stop_codon:yes gene_type:complete
MTYTLHVLKKDNKDADVFFDEIDTLYTQNEQAPISQDIKKKLFEKSTFLIEAFIILKKKTAIGIFWVELTTPHYGNLTIYIPNSDDLDQSISLIKQKGYFNKKIIELVAMVHFDEIKQLCFELNLTPNIRKRMYLWLNELNQGYVNQNVDFKYTFQPYTKDLTQWGATVSVESHKISKDYEMYEEMLYVDKRKRLEDRVMEGLYGPVLESSSLVLSVDNTMVGYSLVVLVECWGYKQVPWIFDICVDPHYHGKGYGKLLANTMVQKIAKEGFEIMGLAVTLSNSIAMTLYQKQGFKDLDIFYEFVDP